MKLFFVLFFVFAACSAPTPERKNAIKPRIEVQAASLINDSFVISDDQEQNKPYIKIKRHALEKEFLLQASMITQEALPSWQGVQSRVVAFRFVNQRLFLMQANQGHQVTDELPQELLITEFPVIKAERTSIQFDWNEGMKRVFVSSDWTGQDYEGSSYKLKWNVLGIRSSYTDQIKFTENRFLSIRQVAQVQLHKQSELELVPLTVRYFLEPYTPSAGFVPSRSYEMDNTGFFEIAPRIDAQGQTIIYASKFDLEKPIEFGISSNTPELYRQAVKDGISYWNKAFERDLIQVKMLSSQVVAPDYYNNVVQWVTADDAGFAYADAQMDPRSGEILHAQVYLTSVFAVQGRLGARLAIRRARERLNGQRKVFSLESFQLARKCHLSFDRRFVESMTNLLASGASDEQVLRVSQDFVREVVAHEIGHTLGLRHNFAASINGNIPYQQRNEIFDAYLQSDAYQSELHPSSSVMDYQRFEEGALTGQGMRKNADVLAYDRHAIQVLYNGSQNHRIDNLYFCTDSHIEQYADCKPFDFGSQSMDAQFYERQNAERRMANFIIEQFVMAKAPFNGQRPIKIDDVGVDPSTLSFLILRPQIKALTLLTEGQKFIKARWSFAYINWMNQQEVVDLEQQSLAESLSRNGGLAHLLRPLDDSYEGDLVERFTRLIESPRYRSGLGYGEQRYQFSDQEIQVMISKVSDAASRFAEALLENGISKLHRLLNEHVFADFDDRIMISNALETWVLKALLQKSKAPPIRVLVAKPSLLESRTELVVLENEKSDPFELVMPIYKYDDKTRLLAAQLYSQSFGAEDSWAFHSNAKVKKQFEKEIKSILRDYELATLPLEEMPADALRWIRINAKIAAVLSQNSLLIE
jgi:hypothetical protein